MENEVITYEQAPTLPSVYSDIGLYNQVFKMAETLSKTDLIPQAYKGKPENCLIAIDTARQVGASPLFVMQNLYVVKGKPSWSGQYCAAVVKANFKNVHLKWYKDEGFDKWGCRVYGTDRNGNECEGTKITIEMAKKEGWYQKDGSKWLSMPEQMLQYRAYAFFARANCPEKLLGIYDINEAEDMEVKRSEQAKNLQKALSDEEIIDVESLEVG